MGLGKSCSTDAILRNEEQSVLPYLVSLWEKTLDKQDIDLEDDFFELGGSSLSGIQMMSEVQSDLKAEIELENFFENPSIRNLARLIREGRST